MSSSHVVSQVEVPIEKTIDREKMCPLLLRIFCAHGRHNSNGEYARGSVPPNELQIYTWVDCTLKELTSLIKDVNPDARRRGTEFNFAIVTPDRYSARYAMHEVGITISGQRAPDDDKTLSQCKFEVGDFIDVVINPPEAGGMAGRGNGAPMALYGGGPGRRSGGERGMERDRVSSTGGAGGGARYGGGGYMR
uniref:18 kDa Sin3-associated polypeptide n=1 Tax=Globodera pallida TaxID=36090 RepID=A0A183C5N1_GLOPA